MSAAKPTSTFFGEQTPTSTFLSEQTPTPPPPTFFGEQTPTSTFLSEPTPTFFDKPHTIYLLLSTSDEDPLMEDITDNPFEIRHKIKEGGNTKSNLNEIHLCCSDSLNREDRKHSDNCLDSLGAHSILFGLGVKPVIEWKPINCRGKNYIQIKLTFEIKYFSNIFDDFSKQIQKYKDMCKNLLFEIDENIDYNSLRLTFYHNRDRSDDFSYDRFDDLCFSKTDISVQYVIFQSDGPSKVCELYLITVEYDPFPDISNIKIIGHPSQIVPSIIHNSRKKQKKQENPLNFKISFGLNCIHADADSSFEYKMPGIFSHLPFSHLPEIMRVNPCISVSDISEFFQISNSECDMGIIRKVLIRLYFKSTEEQIDMYDCFQQEISVQINHLSPKLVIKSMYNPESSSSCIILVMVKTVNDVGSTTEVLFYIHIDDDQDESSRFQVIRSIGKPDEKGNLHLPDGYSLGMV